ncbi:IPExxxVDY family protein [Maribacter sp. 2307ULW6-5]|uniref:IPExxxVDY family protein n=1 Tax=Maribacter sp. 2307ULW6-5 TaxID=3386275 RepID=UPI0039BCDD5D
MAVHKINDALYDEPFLLVALHSNLKDYALAYALNKMANTGFKRAKKDFELNADSSFPYFVWEDTKSESYWALVANQSTTAALTVNNDLFQNQSTLSYQRLLPELKEVDFFIKIEEGEYVDKKKLIENIMAVPNIRAAYEIDTDKLKSKNNLIF